MPEMKTLNGYEVVDAKAREDIEALKNAEVDLTGYATEAYVDNAIDNIPEVDLSKHALKSELPTKVSQLQNDSKFITREEVPETDLSAYAKKSEIPDVSDFITSIPSEYITESELNAKGYLTQHQDISHLAPKSSIPTKVSQLANDSNYLTSIPSTYITEAELEAKNYLTEHQSLAAYATKTFVENTVAENQPNLSGYAKKSDIPDVSDFISEIPSEYVTDSELAAKKYATESYVGEAIAQAQLGGEDVDLSDYAKKADVPTKTSQLTNDSNFITAIPAEYVTETELNNKGYLTQHQSLDDYATKSYVDDAVSDCKDVYLLDFSKATEYSQPADEQMISFGDSFLRNLKHDVSVMIKVPSSPDYFWPALVSINDNSVVFSPIALNLNYLVGTTPSPITWDTVSLIRSYDSTLGDFTWTYTKLATSSTTIANTDYVDNAIANIDIPEGSGGIVAYTFNGDEGRNVITDEERAVVEAVYKSIANGTGEHEDYLFYVRTSKGVFPVISVEYDANAYSSQLKFIYNHDIGTGQLVWNYIGFNIDASTGACSNRTRGSDVVNSANWYWSSTYTAINVSNNTYRHVRIVGYYGVDTTNVATFDMSCPYNNKFINSPSNPYFVFPDVFKVSQDGLLKWRYESNVFKLYVDGEVTTDFHCTGVWTQVE